MNFSVEELPETAEERAEYVNDWAEEEGFEVAEPSLLQENEEYSLAEMEGMATETGGQVIDTLIFAGEDALPEGLDKVVNIDPRDDDPGLAPTITPEDLDRHWSFIPYRADSHAEANIEGNDSTQLMIDEYDGLMMTEMRYDDTKVADALLGPVIDAHEHYGPDVTRAMEEESAAVATAAENVLGEAVETGDDMEGLQLLMYEASEVPVNDSGEVTEDKPAVMSWYAEDDQLYLVPERVSVAVGDENETSEAYIGAVRGGYVDLNGDIQAPFPPLPESENPLEAEQDYFTTMHNV